MNTKTNKYEYVEQPGCHMCGKCFILSDFDGVLEYYCTFDAPPRPRCGSSSLGEDFRWDKSKPKQGEDDMDKWEEWSENREVKPWGICKKFES